MHQYPLTLAPTNITFFFFYRIEKGIFAMLESSGQGFSLIERREQIPRFDPVFTLLSTVARCNIQLSLMCGAHTLVYGPSFKII